MFLSCDVLARDVWLQDYLSDGDLQGLGCHHVLATTAAVTLAAFTSVTMDPKAHHLLLSQLLCTSRLS